MLSKGVEGSLGSPLSPRDNGRGLPFVLHRRQSNHQEMHHQSSYETSCSISLYLSTLRPFCGESNELFLNFHGNVLAFPSLLCRFLLSVCGSVQGGRGVPLTRWRILILSTYWEQHFRSTHSMCLDLGSFVILLNVAPNIVVMVVCCFSGGMQEDGPSLREGGH